jgi:hypothetical protein
VTAMETLPENVLNHMRLGGFSYSVSGKNGSSVALDEAHVMLINKDANHAARTITAKAPDRFNTLCKYLPISAAIQQNFEIQGVQVGTVKQPVDRKNLTDACNILKYMQKIRSLPMLMDSGLHASLVHLHAVNS